MRKIASLITIIIFLTLPCMGQSSEKLTSVNKDHSPILMPGGEDFQSKAVYNPTVIVDSDTISMIYRAEGKETGTGVLALAFSKDGKIFEQYKGNPVVKPEFDYEAFGCEDPRVVKINNKFYLTYVGNDHGKTPGDVCLATSEDFINWEKHGEIIQPSQDWDKSKIKAGVIAPEIVNGKYIMYFLGETKAWETSIGIAFSDDLLSWEELTDKPVITPRKGYFDSKGVEPGATPVIMNEGILLIYNGWDDKHIYKTGWVLFSKDDPAKVVARCKEPIIEPELDFEKIGYVNNVTFAEGIILFNGIWHIYYGAADKCIGLVTIGDFERLFQ